MAEAHHHPLAELVLMTISPPSVFRLRPVMLALLCSPCLAHAADASQKPDQASTVLEAVTVTGARAQGLRPNTVEAGSFRGANIMEVPSTVNVVTREALDLQAAGGLYDAVRNTAGVTRQQNGGETWDQLVIRGMTVENRTNYRLNGSLSIMNFSQVPMEDKERVEVLKGASALYYGFTSPAGVVNFVTKRAGATPVTRMGMSLDNNGSAVLSTDMARRFGAEKQYGLRVNAAGGALGSYLDGVDNGSRKFGSAAFDWRASSRLLIKADLEYDRRKTTEQVGVALPTAVNDTITLPHTVDPKKMVGPDISRFETESTNALLRADYSLSDDWALTLEAGHSQTERDRRLAIFRFNNAAAVTNGEGRIQGNIQNQLTKSDLFKGELFGAFNTYDLRHELTLGLSQTDKSQDPIYQSNYTIASQNLYAPRPITTITYGAVPTNPTTAELNTTDIGLYATDRITLSQNWLLITGVRHSMYRSDQADNHYDVSKTTPMLSAVYKLAPTLSFYASYAQGLEEGDTAPTGTVNQGERMAPGVSKQHELGMRWISAGGTLVSAALFNIQRPGAYTNDSNVYVADGEQQYRGLELSTQGQLSPSLSWQTSAQWLDPRFRHTAAAYNGKLPENAARRTASAFLSYELPWLAGLSINGGAYYTGRRPVNDLNQAWLPGVTLFSAGSRYITSLYGKRTTWQLNVENLTDKHYWAGAGTRLAAGAPRTIKLGFTMDL